MPPRIIALEMQGFKSFAKRTSIPFLPTFNVIVGPNGSGKSNVLDALIFVLGKAGAKGMRAEKTANLLYNGGKRKKPASKAEVTLILSNEDKSLPFPTREVRITRILKKDGSSEYRVNDQKVTRTFLMDVLAKAGIHPDGYNIILQGDITRFVDMSGQERRQIIEEIAGLRVYEEKREKAERELARTEEKLREADILLAEREAHLKELEADREQALAYQQLEDELRDTRKRLLQARLSRVLRDTESLAREEERLTAKRDALIKDREALDAERKRVEEALEQLREELDRKGEDEEKALRDALDTAKQRLTELTTRLRMLDTERERVEHRIAQLHEEKAEVLEKKARLEQHLQEVEERMHEVREEKRALEEKLKALRKKHGLEDRARLEEELRALEREEEALQEEILTLKARQQELLREQDMLEYKLRELEKQREKIKSLEDTKGVGRLREAKQRLARLVKEIERLLTQDATLARKHAGVQQKIRVLEENKYKLEEQVQQARRSLGGSGVVDLLKREKLRGVHGMLIELIRIPNEYVEAIEAALGARMFSIIVDTLDTAKEAIRILKREKAGLASFIPLDVIKPPREQNLSKLLERDGVHGLARRLIQYDPVYEKAVRYALGDTVIIKDIDTAKQLGIGLARFVTLDGSVIESSGSVSGGYRQKRKRINLSRLHEDLENVEEELARLREEARSIQEERARIEDALMRAKREKADVEAQLVALEKELSLAKEMLIDEDEEKALRARKKEVDHELSQLTGRLGMLTRKAVEVKTKRQQLRQQMSMSENARVLAELGAFEEQRDRLVAELARLEAERENAVKRLRDEYANEIRKIERIIKQHEEELKQIEKKRDALERESEHVRKEITELEEKVSGFHEEFKQLYAKREALLEEAKALDEKRFALEEELRAVEVALNSLSLKLAEAKARRAALEEEWKQYYGEESFTPEEGSVKSLESKLRDVEARLATFGNVNLKALDLYEETRKQYEELLEKKKHLEEEIQSIHQLMRELEEKKKLLFLEHFKIINDHFKSFFSRLSKKGTAYLELEKPEDPLNGGVYIKVNITGKKFLDIRSLSGGEKTMTALAFIFAIQEHQPAPFYILDEVDAALDRKNSERLAELIKAYSERAQYIVITHNDAVIMHADAIFGVSMDEDGQSSIVSLKLSDAVEEARKARAQQENQQHATAARAAPTAAKKKRAKKA